jgi:PST family polysaccharide transporter
MLKRQILHGTSWLLAGRLFSNAVGLASTLLAARFLMPEDFGLVAIAMGVFGIAGALVELPVGTALVQLKTATKADFDTAWTINFLRGLIVAALMAASAWPIAIVFDDPRLLAIILALASYPVLLGLRNAWFEQYIRDMDFRWEALVETLTKVVSFAVVLGISIATGSYWALPLSLIASGVAAVVLSYVLCPRLPGFCLSEFRKFFGFSVWLGLGQIADSIRDTAGTFLIGKFVGTTRLGAWSVGTQFADRLELVLYSPMERTLFAAFSSIRHDAEHLRETFLKAMHTGFAFIAPVCVGMGLLSPEVIAIALGPKWSVAAQVLGFIAPAMALYLLAGLGTSLATALGHTRDVFRVKVISALVHLPLILAGVHFAGLQGALWASVVTAAIWCGLCAGLVSKIAGVSLSRQGAAIARSAGAALIMASVVITARAMLFAEGDDALLAVILRAVTLSGLGAVTYVVSHFALWQLAGRSSGIEAAALDLVYGRRADG